MSRFGWSRRLLAAFLGLSGLVAGVPAAASPSRELRVERSFEQSWPSGRRAEIEIKLARGKLRVVGTNTHEVHLRAGLGAKLEGLEIRRADQWLAFETRGEASLDVGQEANLAAELELQVPWESSLEIAAPAADVEIQGVGGSIVVRTLSGKTVVQGKPSELQIQSTSGAVQLEVGCPRVWVKNVAGRVEIRGTIEDLRAEMVDGDLRVAAALVAEAHLVSAQGLVEVVGEIGEQARLRVETLAGIQRLRLPPGTEGIFRVSAFDGEFWHPSGPAFTRQGLRREQSWQVGALPRRFELTTFSGRIEILEP